MVVVHFTQFLAFLLQYKYSTTCKYAIGRTAIGYHLTPANTSFLLFRYSAPDKAPYRGLCFREPRSKRQARAPRAAGQRAHHGVRAPGDRGRLHAPAPRPAHRARAHIRCGMRGRAADDQSAKLHNHGESPY